MVTVELPAMSPAVMAAAWVSKLSHLRVTPDDVEGFFLWRRDPVNEAAYAAVAQAVQARPRYLAVGDEVIDVWTGEVPDIVADIGHRLSPEAAQRVARDLNALPRIAHAG
jgi:hypothetical protein